MLVVAIALTIGTVSIRNKMKKGKSSEKSEVDEFIDHPDETKEDEEITLTDKIFTCSNCGANMSLSDTNCHSCGSLKPVCIVCLSDLKEKETIVKLTCCSSYAHKEHIDNWVSVKGHCPKCLKEINVKQNILLL